MHHYHANPIALRYQLGDHVDFNAATDVYTESTNAITRHSPILGWVADGFPVYGPYGFSSASNSASGIRRMVSGYVIRNGQYGTSNLTANGRSTIPAWAARLYNVASNSVAGPAVNTTYPLGRYMEDNDYLDDRGYIKGTDFDLDEYNGRWCVTPEFPTGTYAYFQTIASDGTPIQRCISAARTSTELIITCGQAVSNSIRQRPLHMECGNYTCEILIIT